MRRDVNILIFLNVRKALEGIVCEVFGVQGQISVDSYSSERKNKNKKSTRERTHLLLFVFLVNFNCRGNEIVHFGQQGDID